MDRRKFLKAIALTGAATTIIKDADAMSSLSQSFEAKGAAAKYDLVAVLGGEPEAMFRKAIAELGGMKKFISKGDKVCVKPNIGWDKTPELAANTNPGLVAELLNNVLMQVHRK
jgi:fructose-1,6-bisphosphatase/sedoheptulose 1,7-bisphosphatase-like protein